MRMHRLLGNAILAPALAVLASSAVSNAQFASPDGTWDFVIGGGGQQGLASIEFMPDNTFSGHMILVPRQKSEDDTGDRGGMDDRGDLGNGVVTASTNLFGYSPISGIWFHDVNGRIIGNYSIMVGSGSNAVPHGISFNGKVTPGKRFTLLASASTGRLTFKGVPFQPLTDLSAFPYWYGYKTENRVVSIEVFTLSPLDPSHPNVYRMDSSGDGTGYSYTDGAVIASIQRKIGFALLEVPNGSSNAFLRASSGSFINTPSKTQAKTKGVKGTDTGDVRFKFDATVPALVP